MFILCFVVEVLIDVDFIYNTCRAYWGDIIRGFGFITLMTKPRCYFDQILDSTVLSDDCSEF